MSLPRHQNWEENDDGAEGSCRSPPAKRPRCSCRFEDRQMEVLEEMRRMLQWQNEKIESMYRDNQELREKVSFLTVDISRRGGYIQQSPVPRMLSDQNCSTPLRLQFVNSCSNDKYSTRKIEADDATPLKVAIYDHNNNIVTCEPFSSIRVHIVAIHGDFDDDNKGQWTEEHFRSKIVTGRPGKEHLLSGKLYFRLQGGVGYLDSAKFQDNSSFVPSKRLKLGVLAADERISQRIQEGVTESFAVKDVRGYSTKKNLNPSPCDAVYKLSKIAMNGDRHKLLEKNGIKTVEDILCFYNRSPEDLRKILGKISDQDWDTIISHAHRCTPRPGIYSSCIQERNKSDEHQTFSRSNGSWYLKGSCSVQPSPTLQKQLDVQVVHQQISSTCNALPSGASPGPGNLPSKSMLQQSTSNQSVTPCELESIQVANKQVSSIGNEVLSAPSLDNNTLEELHAHQQCSLKYNTTPDGNGLLPGNPSEGESIEEHLASLENALLEDKSWSDFHFNGTCWVGSCNAGENSMGLSSVNEAYIYHGGFSAASEAGSVSYGGLSPANEVGSRRYMGFTSQQNRE